MRLISCYVENFGGLQQYSFDFEPGLTVVEEPNGFGKTTLATFIRCMFYGMPRRVRDLGKDFRRRYEPWQGGAYGGQLTFAVQGRAYRVERRFGSSPKDDTLTVFDCLTGQPTDVFGEVPGITLFGLDAESFERTAYFPQDRSATTLATTGIRAKLGALMENTDGVHGFDDAMKLLRAARGERMAYRGATGSYYELTAEMTAIDEQLTQINTVQGELARVRDRALRLEDAVQEKRGQLVQVREMLATGSTVRERRALALQCKQLDDAATAAKKQLEECQSWFDQGIPEQDELQQALTCVGDLELVAEAGIDLDASEAVSAEQLPEVPAPKRWLVKLALVYALLLVAGAALAGAALARVAVLFAHQALVGAGVAVIGLVVLVAAAALDAQDGRKRAQAERALQDAVARSKAPGGFAWVQQMRQRACASRDALAAFCQKYGFPVGHVDRAYLQDVWEDMRSLEAAERDFARAQAAFSQFADEHGACAWSAADEDAYLALDTAGLAAQEADLTRFLDDAAVHLAKDKDRVRSLQARLDDAPVLQERMAQLRVQREQVGKDVATLDATASFLEQARDALYAGCAENVQARFAHYLAMLMGEKAANAQINSDFGVSFTQMGATRSADCLSAGYADLTMVCMRMALVDAIFDKEVPCVILDDPFINLDDEIIVRAFDMLEQLAQDHQVVYLTCTASRRP